MKKLKSTDFLFAVTLSSVMLLHIFFLFIIPYFHDETHYATVPFRLINGDSLIQHEWHLTQFASLFSFLPVYIWTVIKGSVEGLFIFLRCVFLLIHTSLAVLIYRFFRKYGKWAILASMIFYVQITYRIQAISYQSMLVIFLLLLTICLVSIYEKNSPRTYVFAGLCFGGCCVCNPLFCVGYILYLVGCVLWTKRQDLRKYLFKIKKSGTSKEEKKLTKKQKRRLNQQLIEASPEIKRYDCFFKKEAILRFTLGIAIIAVIAVAFFFLTGGTIDSVFRNIEHLVGSSEYDITSNSVFSKLFQTFEYFSIANLHMPWILPLIFVVLLLDKNRRNNTHRFAYLTVSVVWSILFMVAVLLTGEFKLFAVSLPYCVFSTICYLLTENRNKPLFNCMFVPCMIAAVLHYLAADTHLAAAGVILAVSNVAGVLFARDLFKEMHIANDNNEEVPAKKDLSPWCRRIIIIGFCIQILFYGIFYMYGQIPIESPIKATDGPFSGLYMSAEQYDKYNNSIKDIDFIKSISTEKDPVLIASYNNWMYLYLDRPMATYTTWYRGTLDTDLLIDYYKENPKKRPKYIYVETADVNSPLIKTAGEIFKITKAEKLSNGILLTVARGKL